MKYLYQAGIILLFTFLGEALAALIPFPVPAAIWGLLLLFAALELKIVRTEQIRDCGAFSGGAAARAVRRSDGQPDGARPGAAGQPARGDPHRGLVHGPDLSGGRAGDAGSAQEKGGTGP